MLKILIVDDMPIVRLMVRTAIEKNFNIEIIEKASGDAAAISLLDTKYDLIISDVEMPNGSGIWLHEFLLEHYSEIPLILFTSHYIEELPKTDKVLIAIVEKFQLKTLCKIISNYTEIIQSG